MISLCLNVYNECSIELFKVNFNMEGFSSRGRVVLGETPVIDAQIIVNGHPRAHSDANGWSDLWRFTL